MIEEKYQLRLQFATAVGINLCKLFLADSDLEEVSKEIILNTSVTLEEVSKIVAEWYPCYEIYEDGDYLDWEAFYEDAYDVAKEIYERRKNK